MVCLISLQTVVRLSRLAAPTRSWKTGLTSLKERYRPFFNAFVGIARSRRWMGRQPENEPAKTIGTAREAWLAMRAIMVRVCTFAADVLGRLPLDPEGRHAARSSSPPYLSTFQAWLPLPFRCPVHRTALRTWGYGAAAGACGRSRALSVPGHRDAVRATARSGTAQQAGACHLGMTR